MKKLLTLVFCFSLTINLNNARAGYMYGNGDIEISRALYNYVEDYLSSGIKNKSKGAQSRGRGTYLAIATSPTEWAGSFTVLGVLVKMMADKWLKLDNCQRGAKKNTDKKLNVNCL